VVAAENEATKSGGALQVQVSRLSDE
jgi:predicted outer membrane repeat protein